MEFEPPPSSTPGSPDQDPLGPDMILEGTEPAWERKEELGFFNAYIETVKQVLLNPAETFDRLFVGGGFVNPLIFMLIGTMIMAAISLIFNLLFGGMLDAMTAAAAGSGGSGSPASMLPIQTMFRGVGGIAGLLLAPIFASIGVFISAGIYHLILMMLGGAKNSYEATFRVVAYSSGATTLLQIVPFCGGIAALVWFVVAGGIGLSRVHQIETWKGVTTILIPMVVCCALIGGLVAITIAGGAAAAASSTSP